jgi:hypothetical protein
VELDADFFEGVCGRRIGPLTCPITMRETIGPRK